MVTKPVLASDIGDKSSPRPGGAEREKPRFGLTGTPGTSGQTPYCLISRAAALCSCRPERSNATTEDRLYENIVTRLAQMERLVEELQEPKEPKEPKEPRVLIQHQSASAGPHRVDNLNSSLASFVSTITGLELTENS
ncbi:fungal specific transcription factor [Colletotrichum kahawae]|uniref:Fungal specific transcription factor n=1 Tax=Colletotrichum kahawae TaxID=34407 RepID=A0AAD9XWZ5_COLKA|nr:fungal specific transcription factor [Colletotrichum kahawae]